jgi:hypothetical protein
MDGLTEPYNTWHWRAKSDFVIHVMSAMYGKEPDYTQFTPRAVSGGKYHEFVWGVYDFATESVTIYEGDITECPFKDDSLKTEVYFPRGWVLPFMRLIASGIIGFSPDGKAIMPGGETGPLVEHPAFESAGINIKPE